MKNVSSQALAILATLALAGSARALQPTGDAPRAAVQPVAQQQIQGRVKSIDPKQKTFTLSDSNKTFHVTDSTNLYKNDAVITNLDAIQTGDQVVATYSGAPDAKKVEVEMLKATSGGGPPGM